MKIGKQKQAKERNMVNISTKVTPEEAELLNMICKARRISIYDFLQLVIQFVIEAAKARTPPTPKIRMLLDMLRLDRSWNNAYNFANFKSQQDIAQVILILQQHDNKQARNGFGMVMIDQPYLGNKARQTLCVDDILERVTEVSMRGLYRELQRVGANHDCDSLRETLTLLCDAQLLEDMNEAERQELPQVDMDNNDWGIHMEYGSKTVSRHEKTIHKYDQQPTIRFTDSDRDTAEAEARRDNPEPTEP